MRRVIVVLASFAFLAFVGLGAADQGGSGVDDEGFITTWLLLAPIPFADGQSGADAVGKEQIKDEAKLQPKPAEKIKVGDKDLVWVEYKAKGYFFDFNDFLGKETEDSIGYAVCYVHADKKMPNLKLKIGSDDQAKVYLNGKAVITFSEPRSLDRDQDTADVTLEMGQNVLVFKVVNEKVDWSGCARFTDSSGSPIKNLKVTATPK